MILEILSDSVESAQTAVRGGADRIELCDNILEGGTTPSVGLMELTRKHIDVDVFAMIRPRGGDFLYTDIEYDVMVRNIEVAKSVGLQGVVLGILKKDGSVDVERVRSLVKLARPMQVTFHRAIDVCSDPENALEDVISTGADRVLTSGLADSALHGVDTIHQYVEQAENRIIIMPGGGITPDNIKEIADRTGASEFHCSAKKVEDSLMEFRRDSLSIGYQPSVSEYRRFVVDEERVRAVRELLNIRTLEH